MELEELVSMFTNFESSGFTPGKNPYLTVDDIAYIGLTKGHVCSIYIIDFPMVCEYRWSIKKDKNTFYARTSIHNPDKTLFMHQLILPNTRIIDHINRNGLDNRRSNLRVADNVINGLNGNIRKNNTSGFSGVSFHIGDNNKKNPWTARLKIRRKDEYLGCYATPEEASVVVEKRRAEVIAERLASRKEHGK